MEIGYGESFMLTLLKVVLPQPAFAFLKKIEFLDNN
jgi:hypothetical protein